MMKLTDKQVERLCDIFQTVAVVGRKHAIEAVIDCYHAMLADSPTYRIVVAPEGFRFRETQCKAEHTTPHYYINFEPIPKPCPPPVLDPVTVTVEDIYGTLSERAKQICSTWEAAFGKVNELKAKGFTHAISMSSDLGIWGIDTMGNGTHRICLRRWEGK